MAPMPSLDTVASRCHYSVVAMLSKGHMPNKKKVNSLSFPPMTVYVEKELRNWFKQRAAHLSTIEGRPNNASNLVRDAMREYKQRIEIQEKSKS